MQGYQKQDSEMGHKSDYRPDVGDTAHGAQRSVAPSNGPTRQVPHGL